MTMPTLKLRITQFAAEAKDVALIELQAPDARELPAFTPGAHLEVRLDNGLIRHYSLLNDASERHRYVIAVGLAPASRGGSRLIHATLRQGDLLQVSAPRNNFPLDTSARCYCFVAGGIGITPILAMIRWCMAQGKDWRLIYSVRNRQRAAFYETLLDLDPERVSFHFNDECAGRFLDVDSLAASLRDGEHLYCCGPDPLMQAVKAATADIPASRIHFEWFSAPEPASDAHPQTLERFSVTLQRSGLSIEVGPDQSILEALEAHGIDVPFSCRSGICGTCETTICSGVPDHRDHVLSDAEQASGNTLMICISRSLSESLVLDL